jgi:putative spermidine/putrescine transport system substrate-binding protein
MRAFTVRALALSPMLAVALPAGATPPPIMHPAKPAPKAVTPPAPAPAATPHPAAHPDATAASGPPALHAILPGSLAAATRDAMRRLLLKPYAEATGTDLPLTAWDGASLDGAIKPATGPVPDLVLLSGAQLAAGCRAQALTKPDWTLLGRDRYLPQAVGDCGVGAFISAIALAWDRDKLPTAPTWSDFWDVARHPGGRGLPRTARFDLEIALLADGVSPGDVYRTLRSGDGLDRAFRKLDQLKPYILWWDKPEQPAQMLAAGHVLLTATPTGTLLQTGDATHRAYGLQWQGSLMELQSWAAPQGAAHPAVGAAALLIAGDIARQADFARATGLGPTVRAAVDLLPPGARGASPTAPGNMQDALFVDEGFWTDNQERLQARFEAWAAK